MSGWQITAKQCPVLVFLVPITSWARCLYSSPFLCSVTTHSKGHPFRSLCYCGAWRLVLELLSPILGVFVSFYGPQTVLSCDASAYVVCFSVCAVQLSSATQHGPMLIDPLIRWIGVNGFDQRVFLLYCLKVTDTTLETWGSPPGVGKASVGICGGLALLGMISKQTKTTYTNRPKQRTDGHKPMGTEANLIHMSAVDKCEQANWAAFPPYHFIQNSQSTPTKDCD